jgi:uncharacterized RDD family membrane protein YckC
MDERFRRVEDEYFRLKGQLGAGRITQAQFDQSLKGLMFEHEGQWWMVGTQSGQWYRYDGQQWVEAVPPSGAAGRGSALPPPSGEHAANEGALFRGHDVSAGGTVVLAGNAGTGGALAGRGYASFGRRFLAYLIDLVILFIAFALLENGVPGFRMAVFNLVGRSPSLIPYLDFGTRMVVYALYFVVLWALWGRTIGKLLVGIKIVTGSGGGLGFGRALVRLLVSYVSGAVVVLGYLWVIWDGKKQAWHDKVAGTYVVRL